MTKTYATDCAFYIGSTHDVCQDYALSGKTGIVISDGCSGSPLTDFGSRVLSVTAINKMAELETLHDFKEEEVILLARPAIKMLNLPMESMDATLLCTKIYDSAVEAICYGDGVIAVKLRDGNTFIINCVYTDSFPFYMNYLYDKTGRYQDWKDNHNKKKITLSVIKEDGEVKVLSEDCDTDVRLKYEKLEIGLLRIQELRTMVDIFALEDVESIAIMSDGIHSFYETIQTDTVKKNHLIPYIDVLRELLPFKNCKGKFVQRRINKFRKICAKNNWHNADDMSLAAIYVEGI
jgi:hypothetical protein